MLVRSGTRTNTPVRPAATIRDRLHPYALRCTSAPQYVTVAATAQNSLDGLSAATLIVRVKLHSVQGGAIIASAPSVSDTPQLAITNATAAAGWSATAQIGGATVAVDVAAPHYKLGVFYTLGLRYDGSELSFWLDGQKVQAASASGSIASATGNAWTLNATDSGSSPHDGSYAFLRAWRHALSDVQMRQAMNNGYCQGSALDLEFLEGLGTTQERAQNADVSFVGAPTWDAYQGTIRTNLVRNPSFENDAAGNGTVPGNGWYAYNSGGVQDYKGVANDFAVYGSHSFKISASSLTDTGIILPTTGLSAGTRFTVSCWVKTTAEVINASVSVRDNQGNGTASASGTTSARLSASYILTSGTNGILDIVMGLGAYGSYSQGTAWFDGVVLEVDGSDNRYFDGDNGGAWTGTPHASTSIFTTLRRAA